MVTSLETENIYSDDSKTRLHALPTIDDPSVETSASSSWDAAQYNIDTTANEAWDSKKYEISANNPPDWDKTKYNIDMPGQAQSWDAAKYDVGEPPAVALTVPNDGSFDFSLHIDTAITSSTHEVGVLAKAKNSLDDYSDVLTAAADDVGPPSGAIALAVDSSDAGAADVTISMVNDEEVQVAADEGVQVTSEPQQGLRPVLELTDVSEDQYETI